MTDPFAGIYGSQQAEKEDPFAGIYSSQKPKIEEEPELKKEEQGLGKKLLGLGKQFVDGLTMGALPQSTSLNAAYVEALTGNRNAAQAGVQASKNVRQELDEFRDENPKSSFVAQLTGGIASPVGQALGALGASALPAALTPANATAQAALRSGLGGSIGAGTEMAIRAPEGHVAEQAFIGAITGLAGGAALGAATHKWLSPLLAKKAGAKVAETVAKQVDELPPTLPWYDGPASALSPESQPWLRNTQWTPPEPPIKPQTKSVKARPKKLPWDDAAEIVAKEIEQVIPEAPAEQVARVAKAITHPSGPINTEKLVPETVDMLNRIDFDNVSARAARELEQSNNLATSPGQRIRKLLQDFLVPVETVDPVASRAAHQFNHVSQQMHVPVEQGIFINGEKVGPSLREVMAPFNGDMELSKVTQAYRHALNAVNRNAKHAANPSNAPGIMTDDAANAIIRNIEEQFPQVKELNQGITKWWEGMIRFGEDRGVLNPATARAFLENPDYIATARSIFGKQGFGFLQAPSNPQSDKLIGDMWHSMHDAARLFVYQGEKNKVLQTFAERSLQNPELAKHVRILPGIDDELAQVAAKLKLENKDVPETLLKSVAELLDIGPRRDQTYSFRSAGGGHQRIGLSKEFEVMFDDLFGARPFEAQNITAKHWWEPSRWINSLRKAPAEIEGAASHTYSIYRDVRKGGTVFDALEAGVNIKSLERYLDRDIGFNPFVDPFKGLKAISTGDERLAALMAEGGGVSGRFANPTAELEAKNVTELFKKAGFNNTKLRFSDPFAFFRELSGNIANMTRAGAGLRALEKGVPIDEAAFVFNNIVGDPYTRGQITGAMMKYIRFFNYPIQANTRMLQTVGAISEGPLAQFTMGERAARFGIAAGRAAAYLTPFTVASYMLRKMYPNEAADIAQKSEAGNRYTFFPNPFNPEEVIAQRKPYAYGALFMNPVEQFLNYTEGKDGKEAALDVAKGLLEELTPNLIPIQATGLMENVFGNRFDPMGRGGSLIPSARARLLPEDQAEASASNTAQKLSAATQKLGYGISAGKIENTLRTFAIGGSYNDLLAIDKAIFGETGPKAPSKFNPFSLLGGDKLHQASVYNAEVREFYSNLDKYTRIEASLQAAEKNGDDARIMQIEKQFAKDWPIVDELASFKRDMDKVNEDMNDVKYRRDMTPEQKRLELDMLLWERGRIAQEANGIVKELKKLR